MNGENIIIREGTSADANAVHDFAFPIMQSFGLIPDPDGMDFELCHFGERRTGIIAQLVACRESEVIGCVSLTRKTDTVAKLTGFYVSPEHRGLGAGKKLLQHTIMSAYQADMLGIYLETWDAMASAVKLYKSFGWNYLSRLPESSGAQSSYYLNLDAPGETSSNE
jgi:ribosomal protein S18 acetylase RimI-like enzyme